MALMVWGVSGWGAAAADPFAPLAGQWTGGGTVTFANGARDRIRCKAENTMAGNVFRHLLHCASDSYKFEMSAELSHADGVLSGIWAEVTRNVSGRVSGQAADGDVQASVRGSGYSASVRVIAAGDAQTIRVRPEGEEVTDVAIELRKGGA